MRRVRRWVGASVVCLLAACGPEATGPAEADLSLGVSSHPEVPVSGEPIRWELVVRNDGNEPASLLFPTTQRGDVRLAAETVDVYEWAERRAFSQDREEVVVLPGDTVSFRLGDDELAVPPGDYELFAIMEAVPAEVVARETVTVRGSG